MRKGIKKEGRGHMLKGHINLSTVYSYLRSGVYPPGLSDCDKRAVRKRAKSFCLNNDELFFIEPKKVINSEDGEQSVLLRKVLTSEEERRKTVLEAHIDPEGTHFGIEKTTNAVSTRYYWVGISRIVRDIISNCAVCQAARSNVSTTPPASLSRSVLFKQETEETTDNEANNSIVSNTPVYFQADMEPATYFWEKVELQILGPFGCGRRKLYIAVALDIYSLWPEVSTLADKTPASITHFLINLVCRYGVMKSLILRENDEVKSGDVLIRSDLLSQVGIELALETFHVTETKEVWDEVESSIVTFTETQPDIWSQCLELCMMPLRVSRPQRAEYTPAYLAHGREFNLPEELSHQETNSYVDVHMTEAQRTETTNSLMKVHRGYGNSLRVVDTHQKSTSLGFSPFMVCVEPGVPCPTMKVAYATVPDEEVEKYKDGRTIPKTSVIKTVSLAPPRPLEKGQKELIYVSLFERTPREKMVDESGQEMMIKKEQDLSDVEISGDMMTSKDDCDDDPDYMMSTPAKRKRRSVDKPVGSTRVTTRSSNKSSVIKKSEDGDKIVIDGVQKVFSSESPGHGFGMDDLDTYYSAIHQYKVDGKYPEGFTTHQKRVLRKTSHSYYLQEDVLCYLQGARSKRKVVIKTTGERLALLRKAHIMDSGQHICRNKLMDILDSWNVYWKGLTLDCEAYVRACTECNLGREKTKPDLTPSKTEELEEEEDVPVESDDDQEVNYDNMVMYLKLGKFPARCQKSVKGRIRSQSKNFRLVDDVLYFMTDAGEALRQVLVTERERTAAIREAHSDYHYGKNRMCRLLREKYYWWRMVEDVVEFTRTCSGCESQSWATEEELARRRTHMSDRVSWFQDRVKNQDNAEIQLGEEVIQRILKLEQIGFHEVGTADHKEADDMEVEQDESGVTETEEITTDHSNTVLKHLEKEKVDVVLDKTVDTGPSEANQDMHIIVGTGDKPVSDKPVEETITVDLGPDSSKPSVQNVMVERSQDDAVISVKVFGDLDNSDDSVRTIVIEPLPDRDHESTVIETQTETSDQSKMILVSSAQDIIESGLMATSTDSAVISDKGMTVTASETAPGSVQMMMVSSDQWNPQDLNILNERVRMPSSDKVCVEQLQEQDQSVILSTVSKAALSSGNALAELVKATVGDLGTDETADKESETASAVASIPAVDLIKSEDNDMEVDEEDDDYVPEELEEEVADNSAGKKKGVGSRTLNRFTCEVCGKEVKGEVTFKVHMYKHTGVKPFACEVCNKRFTNNKSLRIHRRVHTGDLPFLCNLCGKGFSRATSLRYHLKAHDEGGGVPVSCDVCGREFTTANRLEKHKNAKHPVQAKVFQCTECGKVFTAQRSLKRHMVSHQGIRQYQCQVCGRGFFRKEYLNSHLTQHPEVCVPSQRAPKPRPKKKPVPPLDPTSDLQVQSVVQVASGQSDVNQATDSTTFVFPQESVQYEVECLTSESTLTEADLKAIHFLAQASIHGQF